MDNVTFGAAVAVAKKAIIDPGVIESTINDWLDDHPEATTTVQDGSLTDAKLSESLKLSVIKDYVTPEMFGAVADAFYYHDGAWYKDSEFTTLSTDNTQAFQSAVDSGKFVLVPTGSYYLAGSIYINNNGVTIAGCGSEETGSMLRFINTNGIIIASGYRLITIKNIALHNSAYSCSGVEISKQNSSESESSHYITVNNVQLVNFKYGFCFGGYSETDTGDAETYLWNCAFRDIKINTLDDTGDSYGIKFFYNNTTNFGIIFERVYINGYKYNVHTYGTNLLFNSCNFGLNSVNALYHTLNSYVEFNKCNFECDSKITGSANTGLLACTSKAQFIGCNFIANTDNNISFIDGGLASEFVFIGNSYKKRSTDEMVYFFTRSLSSAKGSIVFAGGNKDFPRPNPYSTRSLQILDIERSVLPIKYATNIVDSTDRLGEMQFDAVDKTGGRPIWYDGQNWMGSAKGTWIFIDEVAASGSSTFTVTPYSDRPRTSIVTVRGHQQDVYAIGILCKYRNHSLPLFVPMYSNKCSVAVSDDTVTVTNGSSDTQYMYASVIDLI